jgi:hypothetical protein
MYKLKSMFINRYVVYNEGINEIEGDNFPYFQKTTQF